MPVDFIRKQIRSPLVIAEGETPGSVAVHVETGDRALASDMVQYRRDSEFRRNSLIAAIGLAAVAAGAFAMYKNPALMKHLEEEGKKLTLKENLMGAYGPTALALGTLGLLNEDKKLKRNLLLATTGALATYKASRGDTSKVPLAIKAVGLGAPLMSAGLTYAGARAEKLEDRKNVITQIFPAGRYVAPKKLLAVAEGHTVGDIVEKVKTAKDARKELLDAGIAAYERGDMKAFKDNASILDRINSAPKFPPKPKPSLFAKILGKGLGTAMATPYYLETYLAKRRLGIK